MPLPLNPDDALAVVDAALTEQRGYLRHTREQLSRPRPGAGYRSHEAKLELLVRLLETERARLVEAGAYAMPDKLRAGGAA